MVRAFSRWQGISLGLKIKKVKAGIYFYFMEQHHSGGRNRSGRIPFRTDDHELLLKEDMAAQIGIFTFRSQCLILPLIPIGILSNMLFQGIGQQGKAAFLSACRQGIVFLPLIFLLPEWIGLAGVEIAQALSDGLTAIISIPFVFCYFQKSEKKEQKKDQ